MEAKIQKYMIKEGVRMISEYMKYMTCEHKWQGYELGTKEVVYFCQKCNFHTGIGGKLNKLIKKLLAKNK